VGFQSSKIYIAAAGQYSGGPSVGALIRCNLDGTLDLPWGPLYIPGFIQGGGIFLENNTAAYALTFLSPNPDENKILVAGEAVESSTLRMRVWSFNTADGSTDTAFGTGGKMTLSTANSSGRAIRISFTTGVANRIIVAGTIAQDFAAVRLFLGGTVDTTF